MCNCYEVAFDHELCCNFDVLVYSKGFCYLMQWTCLAENTQIMWLFFEYQLKINMNRGDQITRITNNKKSCLHLFIISWCYHHHTSLTLESLGWYIQTFISLNITVRLAFMWNVKMLVLCQPCLVLFLVTSPQVLKFNTVNLSLSMKRGLIYLSSSTHVRL